MRIPTQRKPAKITVEQAHEVIAETVRTHLNIGGSHSYSARRAVAVKILRPHGFTIVAAQLIFKDAVKAYRAKINPEFSEHIFNLWFIGLDGKTVYVKNQAHSGYVDISSEPPSKALVRAMQQKAFLAANKDNRLPEPQRKERRWICANCDFQTTMVTNHIFPCLNYCHGCSWKPSQGHFPRVGKDRIHICLEDE
jgi:hypothetical protein